MNPRFMKVLQDIRDVMQEPMIISSGYRSIKHTLEASKDARGEHTLGLAVDVVISGQRALKLIYVALMNGVQRIGIKQHGVDGDRYIHLGFADKVFKGYPPGVWTYGEVKK